MTAFAASARRASASLRPVSSVLKVMWMRAEAHGATEFAEVPPLTRPVLTVVSLGRST